MVVSAAADGPAGSEMSCQVRALTAAQLELVEDHVDLVEVLVGRMRRRTPPNVDVDGLRSAGQVGLLEAARGFDPDRGVPFGGYARRRIWGALLDELRSQDWVPRRVRDAARSVDRTSTAAAGAVASAAAAVSAEAQLARLVPLPDRLEVPGGVDPQQVVADRELVNLVHAAVDALPPAERTVVAGVYLSDRPFATLAAELGVSPSRVSQLRSNGLAMVRQAMAAAGEDGLVPGPVGGSRAQRVAAQVTESVLAATSGPEQVAAHRPGVTGEVPVVPTDPRGLPPAAGVAAGMSAAGRRPLPVGAARAVWAAAA